MLQTPDVFTYDLHELNNSLVFIVSLSNVTGRHIKVSKSGALAVFKSFESFEHFKIGSQVAKDSSPYEVTFQQMKEIANKETDGFYEIL
jgi:hypothetical protein